ncbi:MAG: hypothetical protein HOY71_50320, partial [Nonomuraea sp.]|nr:hypothetical protein [Nonomuraea sp.]
MIEFRGAGPAEFVELLDTVLDIYTAAMRPPADQINGRKAIMRNHATYPRFQCYFAELRDLSPQATPLRGSVSLPPAPRQGARLVRGSEGGVERFDPRTRIVAFAYGFHGAAGQWWHDVVFRALDERAGRGAAEMWMGDAFE